MPFIFMLAAPASFLFLMAYNVSDGFYIFVRRLFGAEIIHIRGVSSVIKNEYWKAVLHRDPWGDLYAHRYPSSRIGFVRLNDDGTGEYCGSVEWRAA